MAVRPGAFALRDRAEQERALDGWGEVLASCARDGSPVHRLQWIEQTVPALGDDLAAHFQRQRDRTVPLDSDLVRSYIELVETAAPQTTEHDRLNDMDRADHGAMIVGRICPPDERLPVVTLAAELEEMVVGGMQDPTTGQVIIEPDLARSLGERVAAIVSARQAGEGAPALVVQPRARRPMSALLKLRAPGCLVISINELPVAQPIEVIAVIGGENELPRSAPALPEAVPHEFEREALAA
jgi:hypothetical protein